MKPAMPTPVCTYKAPDGLTDWPAYSFEQMQEYARKLLSATQPAAVDREVVDQTLDDLSTLVVRLVRALRTASPGSDLPGKALDYLYRKNLAPSILRGGAFGEFAAPLDKDASKPAAPFQERVQPWMLECFGPEIAADKIERNHRFFEEATEAVQANGMTRSEAHQLVDYTFNRPVGELKQEIGGVMVTLAALCLASGIDMHLCGEQELYRINQPYTIDKIRAKQAAKPKHSPLPAAPSVEHDERGAFEASFKAWVGQSISFDKVTDDEGDERYADEWLQGAWIGWQARAASTSANVAQGAEASFECTHYDAFTEAHKQVAVEVEALREMLGIKTAPPTPTALTDDVLMQAIADTAARGHVWASRALSNFRAAQSASTSEGKRHG